MTDQDDKDANGVAGHHRRNNMAASVRSCLIMLAHTQGEGPEYLLTRYTMERLLYRLGQSTYAGAFIYNRPSSETTCLIASRLHHRDRLSAPFADQRSSVAAQTPASRARSAPLS